MALSRAPFLSFVWGLAAVRPEKSEVHEKPMLLVQESSRIVQTKNTSGHVTEEWHLTEDGAKACDYGVTVTETDCWKSAKTIVDKNKVLSDRSYLVSGSITNAPPGCSIETQMDWAVTYNTNQEGENDGNFALVCHGLETKVHGVKEGESECDFGTEVKVDKCLDAVNSVLTEIEGDGATLQDWLHIGHWATVAAGCSMHAGSGKLAGKLAWYNTKKDAKNDGSYVLLCSGTTVPTR